MRQFHLVTDSPSVFHLNISFVPLSILSPTSQFCLCPLYTQSSAPHGSTSGGQLGPFSRLTAPARNLLHDHSPYTGPSTFQVGPFSRLTAPARNLLHDHSPYTGPSTF